MSLGNISKHVLRFFLYLSYETNYKMLSERKKSDVRDQYVFIKIDFSILVIQHVRWKHLFYYWSKWYVNFYISCSMDWNKEPRPIDWPAHSPDFSPLDFFFCRPLKSKMYARLNLTYLIRRFASKDSAGMWSNYIPNSTKY